MTPLHLVHVKKLFTSTLKVEPQCSSETFQPSTKQNGLFSLKDSGCFRINCWQEIWTTRIGNIKKTYKSSVIYSIHQILLG